MLKLQIVLDIYMNNDYVGAVCKALVLRDKKTQNLSFMVNIFRGLFRKWFLYINILWYNATWDIMLRRLSLTSRMIPQYKSH